MRACGPGTTPTSAASARRDRSRWAERKVTREPPAIAGSSRGDVRALESRGRPRTCGKLRPTRGTRARPGGRAIMARLTRDEVLKKADALKNWGKWGPDDELGVLNYITPEDIVNAARLVKKGKVFRLGLNLDENGPQRGIFGARSGRDREARRLRDHPYRPDGRSSGARRVGRLRGRRRPRPGVRDRRLDPRQADRRHLQRHLGDRGASQRHRARRLPALALGHDPRDRDRARRDLLSEGARRGLRRRRRLRVLLLRAAAGDHPRDWLADQSPGHQVAARRARVV